MNDEQTVLPVLERSAIVRFLNTVVARVQAAHRQSRVVERLARGRTRWHAAALARRRAYLAVMLIAAVVTHVMVMAANARPDTWLWLIIPGVLLAAAALVFADARWMRQGERRERA